MAGKKKTTLQDIADALDITPSAVSKALHDHPRISEKTKRAVLAMAKKLSYHPNTLASALRSGQSFLLGVIVPDIDFGFFSSVVRGIEEVSRKAGYHVIISQSHNQVDNEQANVEALLRTQVDGVLASLGTSTTDFDHFRRLIDNDVPLLLFDRTSDQLPVSTVVVDDFGGAYAAVEHLIRQQCRRIVHFAGHKRSSLYHTRIQAYEKAMADHGLEVLPGYIMESDLTLADGQALTRKLLEEGMPFDGIFASADHAALGAMHALQENGIKVPEQVAVVGFSNEPFSGFIRPSLSSVDQQSLKMGKLAAETLLQQVRDKESGTGPIRKVLLPELIVRDSSRRLPLNKASS